VAQKIEKNNSFENHFKIMNNTMRAAPNNLADHNAAQALWVAHV